MNRAARRVILAALQRVMHLFRDGEKSGVPWMTRHSVRSPRPFMSKVSEEIVSATPPP
jgi:hypothetical protein